MSASNKGGFQRDDTTGALVVTGSGGGGSTPDADATTKGKIQLAGALGGTAASPTVPGLTSHVADTANPHAVTGAQVGLPSSAFGRARLLDADALTARAAIGITSHYRALFRSAARATTAATSGTKFFFDGAGAANTVNPGPTTVGAFLFRFQAADHAVSGMTTKLRLVLMIPTATAPGMTFTAGLYSITPGATLALNTLVTNSGVAIASPAANSLVSADTGDFDIPADGIYALGYTTSAAPAGNVSMHAQLEVRNV